MPDDLATLERQGFQPIDLVVVNLYPFEATIAERGATFADAIENIDIGGPSLIRAAAKNHAHVAVATSPDQYDELIVALRGPGGTTLEQRRRLATAAFSQTARYDRAIALYLERSRRPDCRASATVYPDRLDLRFTLRQPLRYGENPHQTAAFYVELDPRRPQPGDGRAAARQGALVQQPARPR